MIFVDSVKQGLHRRASSRIPRAMSFGWGDGVLVSRPHSLVSLLPKGGRFLDVGSDTDIVAAALLAGIEDARVIGKFR